MKAKPLFKTASGQIIHRDDVLGFSGISRGSCWGTLNLKSRANFITVGNGSYYNDGRHSPHWAFNFKRFREWIDDDVFDGSKLFEE